MRRSAILTSGTGLILAAALAVAAIIVVNAFVTGLRLDLTDNRLFTLSRGTVNIVRSLEEPIVLDFYFSRKTLADYPLVMNYSTRVRDLLEEYEAKSNGKLKLTVIEPEPFSEAEDEAVANGLQGISLNTAGDRGYFGLVGTNSTDDQATIPFLQPGREGALEYDITKLIYNLANPEKPVVGVISSLPVLGSPVTGGRPWAIAASLREFFEVEDLGTEPDEIDKKGIDVLFVVHPKQLKQETLYAIDQYLLAGGKAVLFVDPLSEADNPRPDPENPYVMPEFGSELKTLLEPWGITVEKGKIAGDINAAMLVQASGERGPQETYYLPWLSLGPQNLEQDDFITGDLEVINTGTAGVISRSDDAPVKLTPLIHTSTESMRIERDLILFQRDPNVMLRNFKPEGKELVIAARLNGHVKTTFPDGPPGSDGSADEDKNGGKAQIKEGDINAILVADTDMLSDQFWVRRQSFFGIDIPQTIANNGDFVVNAVDFLSGSTDLVSLRTRGRFSRPFEVVEKIRRDAEAQFREQEQALQAKLEETERKIVELQQKGGKGEAILTPEQSREIEKFRQEQVKTRKELRAVQHELQKNIERLGSQLKFVNIGLMPILIGVAAVAAGLWRGRRRV